MSPAPDSTLAEADLQQVIADLRRERDEALARETAIAEVLQVINSSLGDLAPVFDEILGRALQLCKATFGVLVTWDGERFHHAASQGLSEELLEAIQWGKPFVPNPGSVADRLVRGENIISTADLVGDESFRKARFTQTMARVGGARSYICIALRKDQQLLGSITIYRQEVQRFSDKEVALLQNFAAQAVIAMENARLITETREALEQQTATAEVLGVINSSPGDLAPVFDAMLDKASRLCDTAFGVFHSFDGEAFHTIALRGAPPALADFYRQPLKPMAGSFAERVAQGAMIVSADDLSADEIYRIGPGVRAVVDLGGGRSFVGIALRKEDRLLGAFWMYRREVRPFSEKEIALLQNFAAQAVIAMENARLITETREALEQQTATAEVLGVINSSPGNLVPVFEAIIEKATRLCDAAFGIAWTYDSASARYRPGVSHQVPPALSEFLRGDYEPAPPSALRNLGEDAFLHILDEADHESYRTGTSALRRALVDLGGAGTVLAVPLRRRDTVLAIYRQEVRAFTDKQIALLQNFAAQAVIAMDNARLITETREALEQQTAIAEVLGVINSSPGNLAPVFDAILEKAMRLCEAAYGHFVRYDGEFFHRVAVRGKPAIVEWQEGRGRTSRGEGAVTFQRLLRGETVVHIPDVMDTDAYREGRPAARALVDLGGCRTLLTVALRKENALVGLVSLYREGVRPFSDKQIALLQNFAAQAVIAMENARLITETREALEQQTATAEVLGVINSSPGDLGPVFDAMLEKATTLCAAPNGQLAIYDGEFFRFVAAHGEASHVHDLLAKGTKLPVSGTTWPRIVAGEHVVHIPDVMESDDYRAGHVDTRSFVEVSGGRSLLTVALRKDNVLLGALSVYRRDPQPFTEKQIALLQNFAAQAVIAMENARLITETREALEQQTATAEVLGVINSSPGDLAPVFDAILEKAVRVCNADQGALYRRDGEGYRPVAHIGMSSEYVAAVAQRPPTMPGRRSCVGLAALEGKVVQIADVAADPEYESQETITLGMARTGIGVPLLHDGETIGVFGLARRRVEAFTEKQIALLQNFAAQAVIAIENARLITETREALEQQTATAEVLGVINSSPGDLAPVFDAMLEKALNLCDAAFGILFVHDAEAFRAVAMRGAPPVVVDFLREPIRVISGGAFAPLLRGDAFVQIADITDDEVYRSGNRARRMLADEAGARTALWVALHRENTLLGTFVVYRKEVRPFTDKQIALLQNFAAQAVIAMENARLITETREALEQQTATAEVLGVINSSPGDLTPVFDAIVERAKVLCDAAFGTMVIADGEQFRTVSAHSVPAEYAEFRRLNPVPPGHAVAAAIRAGEPFIHTLDLKDTDLYRNGDERRRAVVDLGGARTSLVANLRKDGEVLGAIQIYRQEVRPFSEKQIALLQNFAAQAVIAMENARLLTETREALEQQTATAEVLGVINSSPGDLAPVFDAMLEKALRLCGAEHGSLGTYDHDYFRAVASRGYPAAVLQRLQGGFNGLENPVTRPLFEGARFVHIPDLGEIDHPIPKAVAALGGFRTALFVPLRKDGKLLGHIAASRQNVLPFAEKEIALLENFAAQAVIAMENARLLGELRQRTEEVAELNRGLEARVAEQVEELGRVGRLKRFLAPQLAELIVSQGDEKILESHRREIVVVFCDLRGYTAFTETAEPEEVLDFLREYHGALGPLVAQFEGTLDQFSGDGIMVFFNDPVPIPDPAERAVTMAVAMRAAAGSLIQSWRRRGRELGFGAGIAQGYATLGQIGFAERSGYTAIGTVCNLAARLCAEAKDGQILIAQRVAVAVEQAVALEEIGSLTLKGLTQPVVAFNVPATTGGHAATA